MAQMFPQGDDEWFMGGLAPAQGDYYGSPPPPPPPPPGILSTGFRVK
jgi:hypothetical protein